LRRLFVHNNRLFNEINLNPFDSSMLPRDLEANPFLLALINHPPLENVSVIDNGPTSNLLQDRLDSYFLKKRFS
jgi:hypothetical protein